jgi:hypothetical protein
VLRRVDRIELVDPRRHAVRADDATLWVWVGYGLAQASITMLMAFDVITTLTATEVVTAVALILYVAVNELYVRPRRTRPQTPTSPDDQVTSRDGSTETGAVAGDHRKETESGSTG